MTNTQLLDDSKADHMTQKDVKDTGQVATMVDEQNYHHLSTSDGNSIPPPSGRGEDSDGTAEMIQTMNELNSWAADQAVANEHKRIHDEKVAKIEYYLRGSPLAGYGDWMVTEGERTDVNPFLCPAVAEAESSLGRALCGSCNAWGMLGCSFSSWQNGITRWFDNINVHWGRGVTSSYQLRGYCVPDSPWDYNVNRVATAIEGIEL